MLILCLYRVLVWAHPEASPPIRERCQRNHQQPGERSWFSASQRYFDPGNCYSALANPTFRYYRSQQVSAPKDWLKRDNQNSLLLLQVSLTVIWSRKTFCVKMRIIWRRSESATLILATRSFLRRKRTRRSPRPNWWHRWVGQHAAATHLAVRHLPSRYYFVRKRSSLTD